MPALLAALVACAACVVSIGCNPGARARGDAAAGASGGVPPVVDEATARSCTLTYTCGLSHPGLGSYSRSTSVDLGTCEKTVATSSGNFGEPGDASAGRSAVSAAECLRLQKLLGEVTDDDARRAAEAAQMDSTACTLDVSCKAGPRPKITVQRQSLEGSLRVVVLIRALQAAK